MLVAVRGKGSKTERAPTVPFVVILGTVDFRRRQRMTTAPADGQLGSYRGKSGRGLA